jgi:hypothetical protein
LISKKKIKDGDEGGGGEGRKEERVRSGEE